MQNEFLDELGKTDTASGPGTPGLLYAVTGKRTEARRVLEELQRAASRSYGLSHHVAGLYMWLGDKDSAFAWLERTFEERNGALIVMRVEPTWEPVRSDPRFVGLMDRVGVAH
jgi:hypothetical protein